MLINNDNTYLISHDLQGGQIIQERGFLDSLGNYDWSGLTGGTSGGTESGTPSNGCPSFYPNCPWGTSSTNNDGGVSGGTDSGGMGGGTKLALAAGMIATQNYIGAILVYAGDIMDIIQNGFMFSCWNSTFTPSRAITHCEDHLQRYVADAIIQLDSAGTLEEKTNALNQLMYRGHMIGEIWELVLDNNNWQNCSQTALQEVYIPYCAKLKALSLQILEETKRDYTVTLVENVTVAGRLNEPDYQINEWHDSRTIRYPVYKVTKKASLGGLNLPFELNGSWIMGGLVGGTILYNLLTKDKKKTFKSKSKNKLRWNK